MICVVLIHNQAAGAQTAEKDKVLLTDCSLLAFENLRDVLEQLVRTLRTCCKQLEDRHHRRLSEIHQSPLERDF